MRANTRWQGLEALNVRCWVTAQEVKPSVIGHDRYVDMVLRRKAEYTQSRRGIPGIVGTRDREIKSSTGHVFPLEVLERASVVVSNGIHAQDNKGKLARKETKTESNKPDIIVQAKSC